MTRLERALLRELEAERAHSAVCERSLIDDNRGASRLWTFVLLVMLLAFGLAWLRFWVHADDSWVPRILSFWFLPVSAGGRVLL